MFGIMVVSQPDTRTSCGLTESDDATHRLVMTIG